MTTYQEAKATDATRFQPGTELRHHAGSTWRVCFDHIDGDYTIRCIVGTVRPGFIGGETEGTIRRVHADYLHGNGWKSESEFDEPSFRATPKGYVS